MSTKNAVKKPAEKKPEAKKSAAKKPVAKKAPVAKNPACPTPAPGKAPPPVVENPVVAEPSPASPEPTDSAKAVAFAMSIAQEMKASAAAESQRAEEDGIRLSRRPTTRTQGRTSAKFPASDLKEFRRRLLEARAQATSGVNAMRATGFNESEDHEADGGDGTNQTLRLQALGQMGNINRTIQQIDEALHRIDDGTYGVCTACGQLIRKPRLLNQPFVLTCMECQSAMERERT